LILGSYLDPSLTLVSYHYFHTFATYEPFAAMTIELTNEQKIKILNSDDVYSVMQEILLREEKIDQEKEHLWMIGLATNNRILYLELVSLGSVKATTVEPMNVFRVAVMKGAVNVIMVHNHPSGELVASAADKDLTDRLIQVGRILNIQVIDHLIISTESYLSFADEGIMKELQQSLKWVPEFEIVDRIRKEEKKIREEAVREAKKVAKNEGLKEGLEKGKVEGKKEGLQEGIEKGKIEGEQKGVNKEKNTIAKGMKAKGYSIKEIIELTGLTKQEIGKL
jgi:DNA repair protein RadC